MTTITIERKTLYQVREALWQMTKQFNFGRMHESRLRDSEVRVAAHDAMKALEEALAAPATAPECKTSGGDARAVALARLLDQAYERGVAAGLSQAVPATAPEQPALHDAPTEVKQIAEALRQIGLTLVRTSDGYKVLKLGAITAQEDKP